MCIEACPSRIRSERVPGRAGEGDGEAFRMAAKLIYLLGTDGSGKSTMARRLLESLRQDGQRPAYVYGQHLPVLLWLFKLPARLLFMRRTNQFKNYTGYKACKDSVRARHPRLAGLYARLLYLDAWLQVWPRMMLARWRSDVVVVDRYYLDWVVNVSVLQQTPRETMLREARMLEGFLPKAQTHLFLDVSEETAFARKDDIQSVEYLRERKQRYLQLAAHYNFRMIDANPDAETVFENIRAALGAALGTAAAAPAVPA